MRHLILTTDFKPMVGGIAQYLHGLATTLHARGARTAVVASHVKPSGDFHPGYPVRYRDGVARRYGERVGDTWWATRKLNSAFCLVRRCLRARSFIDRLDLSSDRIYIGLWNSTTSAWCRALRSCDHSYRLFAYGREVVNTLNPLFRLWRRQDFRAAKVVYTCSKSTASLVRDTFPGVTTKVVQPGVDGPSDRGSVERVAQELRRDLDLKAETRVLVTVGRLVRRKGIETILEALASPDMSDRLVRYLVAGSGPEKALLQERCRRLGLDDRVTFLGHVDNTVKWAVYRVGDLFVMPNNNLDGQDWEGFGIAFLEAAIMGIPSIAGRTAGAAEAVKDGETGVLVDPGSTSELVDALNALLGDSERRRELGRRARSRAQHRFTWDRAVDRLLGFDEETTEVDCGLML